MNAGIYITKKSFRLVEWDGDVRQYVDKPIKSILHELRSSCYIEDGVTLGDIITLVADDPILTVLIGECSWCDVRAFYAELRKPCSAPSDLKWIELSSFIEIEKPFEHTLGDMDLRFDVCGRDGSDTRWAIDFTPVNEMANVPVKLNPVREIRDWRNWEERPNHELKTDEGLACFSLFDVLVEIFYEISFHGSPDSRNERMGDLLTAVKEIESGEAKLVPFEPEKDSVQ